MGVEEEFLVVSPDGRHCLPMASEVLAGALEHDEADLTTDGAGWIMVCRELQEQQVETNTQIQKDLDSLADDLARARRRLVRAAHDVGARVIAAGTCPVPARPTITPSSRYEWMADRFGMTATEGLVSGLHVHVSVDSDEEAVGVVDRLRTWLPVLLAMSANSPFWQGRDTQYASYRSQLWTAWPTAAPTEVFGSAAAYRREVAQMLSSGALMDEKMVYFPARLSPRYPTVEIRVSDVCLELEDTVLIAALCRALVETAARAWEAGEPPAAVSAALLRLAHWQAARDGMEGELVHPALLEPRPAPEVARALVAHVREALQDNGDEGTADALLTNLLRRGTGAHRQRRVLERTGRMSEVVLDAARATAGT
jgi:carboxylate-amine ligase